MNAEQGESRAVAVGDAVWGHAGEGLVITSGGQVVDANDCFRRWSGLRVEEVRGRRLDELLEFLSEPERGVGSCRDARFLTGGAGPAIVEVGTLPMADGRELLTLRDVTEARHARNELLQKRAALEDSLNGYDIVDEAGRVVYANRAYLDMWGYDRLDEVVGMSLSDHCANPDTPRQIIEAVERLGRTTVECQAKRKDGSTFDALMAVQLSHDRRGNKVYVGTSLDVSERKRLQTELFQLQKMEAVGGLAASLAHDFNNMLSPILGFSELLLQARGLSADQRRQIEQIHLAGERSRALTAQLLAFSRKQVLSPRPTDLCEAVREMEGLLRRMLRDDIELFVHLASEPCRVLVDPVQLHQLVLNLVTNAQDAMPKGGKLTLEVGQRELDEEYCRPRRGITPGRFGELIVSDSGEGMSAETLERVFEPFFTTKGSYGTGLGLASVDGIVRQHGGNVWVYSELQQGTTFKIYLPLTDQVAPIAGPVHPTRPARAGGVILLVEDNDLVRAVAEHVLRANGYEVHTAATGHEAEAWLRTKDRRVDLLLTDVIMADTNARELARMASELHPDLRVLYMSGYTDNVIVHHGVLDAGVHFLQKPFSAGELMHHVRDALETSEVD